MQVNGQLAGIESGAHRPLGEQVGVQPITVRLLDQQRDVLIEDAATAQMQADAIKHHTLGTWGPYSQLPKDDPRRAQFIDGVALRSALNMAVMGFGITDLLVGAGLIIVLAGVASIGLATPGLYLLAGMMANRDGGPR